MIKLLRRADGQRRGAARAVVVWILLVGVLASAATWWWARRGPMTHFGEVPQAAGESTIYYCPMHPTYTSDHPGDCPICNMKLVPLAAQGNSGASEVEGRAALVLDDTRRQLIGVRTGVVARKPVEQSVRAVGRVDYDEGRRSSVNLKISGWAEELFVKATGQEVRAGDPLFALYSPDLIEAQRNYLLALRREHPAGDPAGSGASDLTLHATRERLRLLDQTDDQIRELEAAGDVPHATTIRARMGGVVVRKDLLQGARIEAGKDLLEISDVSKVWVLADVYEYELPLVHIGQAGFIQLPSMPGETIKGEVTYVYPYLDSDSRTVRVRIEAENPEGHLKPGMFATIFLSAPLGEQLVIDAQAVLDTGERKIVFVDHGAGHLEPREVETGARAGDEVVVLRGLEEGDRIVTSGNFLVDSESRLQSALTSGMKPGPAQHSGHGK